MGEKYSTGVYMRVAQRVPVVLKLSRPKYLTVYIENDAQQTYKN